MRLQDKVVVITGAGSGLGRESALLFAREGARVVVTDLIAERADTVSKLIAEDGGESLSVKADVRVEDDVRAAAAAAVDHYGGLDVMYANAGIAMPGLGTVPFEDVTEEQWHEVVEVNLTGVFLACKHAVPPMKRAGGGSIVVTSSAGALVAYPGWSAYGASKGGVNSLVRHLAWELGRYGIRVNALCPAHGMSPNLLLPPDAPVVGRSYEEVAGPWSPADSPIPLKVARPPSLRDNANVALFLASDESQYMSGVCLPSCDGGTLSRVAMMFDHDWQQAVTAPATS
jgi:NAD(P)-dependent dehydrogenase (short-subunit alcohol dehydrogenase family)